MPLGKSWLAILGLLVVAFAGAGVILLILPARDPMASLPSLAVTAYLEGDLLWSTSDFSLSGTLDNVLRKSSDGKTLLLSVVPEEGDKAIPVVYTPPEQAPPLFRQQKIRARVSVKDQGRLVAGEIRVR